MMNSVMVPKNTPMSFQVITFLSIVVSGSDKPTTAIMKAMAVPRATPFWTKTSITGKMPAALEYMGTARTTANGTSHQWPPDR